MQKAFMVAAGLRYDTCTPEELKEHIQMFNSAVSTISHWFWDAESLHGGCGIEA